MRRTSKIKPGNCDGCGKLVEGAVVIFSCRLHCVCLPCLQIMPELLRDWINKDKSCPYCKLEEAVYIENTDFKQPFPQTAPKSIVRLKSIDLHGEPWCCWSTVYDDVIAVGRDDSSIVDILNINGQVISHKLPEGTWVTSGLYLDTEKCLLSVKNPDYVFTCDINPQENTPTSPPILTSLSVLNPICVFAMAKFRYGILCDEPSRFEIFSKRSIYTDDKPKPSVTFTIDLADPDFLDRACGTPEGNICVSNYNNDKVYIYDTSGVLITSVGESNNDYKTVPGGLYGPRSIEYTEDGTLVITCNNGDIHTYRNDKGWKVVTAKDGWSIHGGSVMSGSKVWLIKCDNKSVYVYRYI